MGSSLITLVGQAALFAAEKAADAPAGGEAPAGGMFGPLLLISCLVLLFYFMIMRPQRREQARRQTMLGGVKKNDRVITIGGIYGVVTNVQRETDEVTVKVDEATNTKLRLSLSSIGRVLGDEPAEQSSGK